MAEQGRRKGLAYLAAVLLAQLVVFLGFWGQIAYAGAGVVTVQFIVAVTLTFEGVSLYFAIRLYQLIHAT